jgi:predicted RND superfamily exporter protein
LVALAMIFVLGTVRAGIIAMLPNVFPAVVVFGAMGWWDIPVGIGTMMTASVALGIAVDDTLHFLTWFRIETTRGCDRAEAVRLCFGHCARAMIQTTVICGMGMVVFAFSGFVPTGRFAWLMLTLLAATLVGDLVFLPALLNSSAGKLFLSRTPRRLEV